MSSPLSADQASSVALIILNWNGRDLLYACIDSLLKSDYPHFQIIVVDNHSEDDSVTMCQTHFPTVTIIENEENLGFPKGINTGLRYALKQNFQWLVMLNNDITVPGDWLSHLIGGMTGDDRIGIGGCKLLYPDGQTIQHAGAELQQPLALSHHFFYREHDEGQADQLRDVDYVTGAALCIRRETAEEIGVLDETFGPFYFEEVDYCYRARAAGWRVVYIPQAQGIHHESQSTRQLGETQRRFFHRNRILFQTKHQSADFFQDQFVPEEKAFLASHTGYYDIFLLLLGYEHVLWQLELGRFKLAGKKSRGAKIEGLKTLARLAQKLIDDPMNRPLDMPPKIEHRPFISSMPIFGPLIVAARTLLNNLGPRWYTRLMFDQQELINQEMALEIHELYLANRLNREKIALLQQQIIDLHRHLNKNINEVKEE